MKNKTRWMEEGSKDGRRSGTTMVEEEEDADRVGYGKRRRGRELF